MEDWSPISVEELEALIKVQLSECSGEEAERFAHCRTPFFSVPISRQGCTESVFVVACHGDVVMYYEDVEEGFNLSALRADGSIATPGFEQWGLRIALNQLMPLQHDDGSTATRISHARQTVKKMD